VLYYVGNRQSLAAFLTALVIIACIFTPISFLGAQIFNEAKQLYSSLEGAGSQANFNALINVFARTVESFLPGISNYDVNISQTFDEYVKQGLEWITGHLGSAFSGITSLLLDLLVFFMALYYFLRDGKQFKETLVALSPFADHDDEGIFKRLELAVNSVIKGNLTIAIIQGILTAIGFTIFGVPNGALWGTVAAVAALIPAVGTALVLVPGVLFLIITGHIYPAMGLIIWGVVAVGTIDNFLGPKLIGKGMHLHPLLVLLSVLGGIAFYGPIGILIGPLTLSLLFAFLSIYSSREFTTS